MGAVRDGYTSLTQTRRVSKTRRVFRMNRAKDDITTEYDYDGWGNLIRETINDGTTIKPPLGLPEDLAVGAGGELYLSDLLNPCILQLDWTTGDLAFSNFVVPSDDG